MTCKSPKYSFETSTIITPAEIIQYCKQLRGRIDEVINDFESSSLNFDAEGRLSESSFGFLADVIGQTNTLIKKLESPVGIEIFTRSNELAHEEDRPVFTWEDLRKLYGTERCSEINQALLNLQRLQTAESRNTLLACFRACQDDLSENIKRFGGDTEDRVAAVTQNLKLTTDDPEEHLDVACNWQGMKFGVWERECFNTLIAWLKRMFQINDIGILDLGCGDLRSASILKSLEGVVDRYSKEHSSQLRGLKALDYSWASVEKARAKKKQLMEEGGMGDLFNENDIQQANFFESLNCFEPESFHLVISLMRTIFHGLTIEKLTKFLQNAETMLKPGGVLLVDSLDPHAFSNDEQTEKAKLGDLIHMYRQFSKRTKSKYQPFMPPGIDLSRSSRFEIEDNTAGNLIDSDAGFYPREIITPEYLEYVIKEYGLGFDLEVKKYLPIQMDSEETEMARDVIELGRKWMRDNLLEDYYRAQILERLGDCEQNCFIDEEILRITGRNVEKIMDYVAYHMVIDYPSMHIILTKKTSTKKTAKITSPPSSRH